MTRTRKPGPAWSDAARLAEATAHQQAANVLVRRSPARAREHLERALLLRSLVAAPA